VVTTGSSLRPGQAQSSIPPVVRLSGPPALISAARPAPATVGSDHSGAFHV